MTGKPDLKGGIERESGRPMSAAHRVSSEGGFVLGGNKKGEKKNMRVSLSLNLADNLFQIFTANDMYPVT